MTDDFRITMADIRAAGYCRRSKEFCKAHKISWWGVVRNGIMASELEQTGDGLALQLVKTVRDKRGQQ